MESLLSEQSYFSEKGTLTKGLENVQRTIDILVKARASIISCRQRRLHLTNLKSLEVLTWGVAPENAPAVLAKLQNPAKQSFESINSSLKDIYTALGNYTKALDKVCLVVAFWTFQALKFKSLEVQRQAAS